ncbi:MAG: hypothetical protein PHE19_03070, partial [Candidatus Cloacimonetes bacterium]|nr:hypothetical protein [Candidatus Cloacimonadota bacterium]
GLDRVAVPVTRDADNAALQFQIMPRFKNNILEEDESKDLLDLLNKACKKNKFKMNDYILTIKGVCRACKK